MNFLRERNSVLWAAALLCLSGWLVSTLVIRGNFVPAFVADSQMYIELSRENLFSKYIWSPHIQFASRALGYPCFLRLFRSLSPRGIPWIQLLAQLLAAFCFYQALKKTGFVRRMALGMTVLLFFSMLPSDPLSFLRSEFFNLPATARRGLIEIPGHYFFSFILSDSLGTSLLVIALAHILNVVAKPMKVRYWVALALTTFLAYQVRPIYVILIPFIPLFGFLSNVLFSRTGVNRVGYPSSRRLFLALLAAVLIPYACFCGIRKYLTNQFQVTVWMGASNFSGVTGQILTPQMIPTLSPNLREFAGDVIKMRDTFRRKRNPNQKAGIPSCYLNHHRLSFDIIRRYRSDLYWEILYPLARKHCRDNNVEINRLISSLSWQVFLKEPWLYFSFVINCLGKSLLKLSAFPTFIFLTSLCGAGFLCSLLRRRFGREDWFDWKRVTHEELLSVQTVSLVGGGIFILNLLVVSGLGFEEGRYILPSGCLLPLISVAWTRLLFQAFSVPSLFPACGDQGVGSET